LRGTGRHSRHTRLRVAALGFAVGAMAATLAACGGDSGTESSEPSAAYPVEVTEASFPAEQRLGETSLLRLGIRNSGEETMPALTVTIGVVGEEGRNSALPFGVRDPAPELANADRPVWVLAATYPRFAGSPEPGGATTSNPKTFDFGPLGPGETTDVVWKLSAVRAGKFTIAYSVGAGFGGAATAETADGEEPGGTFVAEITAALPETEVNDKGEIVERRGRDSG